MSADLFLHHVLAAREQGAWAGGGPGRAWRRGALVAAYRTLPKQLLDGFVNVYQLDFELFGYDPRPQDIFESERIR